MAANTPEGSNGQSQTDIPAGQVSQPIPAPPGLTQLPVRRSLHPVIAEVGNRGRSTTPRRDARRTWAGSDEENVGNHRRA